MKIRTLYEVTVPNPIGEPTVWRGDCPRWAARPLAPGSTLSTRQVGWAGPPWCSGVDCKH